MSKQKEVPLATAVTVTREVRIKNLKPLKNYTPYALKTSHFPPHLFHLLLPNSFGPYECSQAAVLTPAGPRWASLLPVKGSFQQTFRSRWGGRKKTKNSADDTVQ